MNLKKTTCQALVASMLVLSFQGASAGMIGAEQAQPAQMQSDRTLVLDTLARVDTTARLQAMGVDPQQARDRIGAMSDSEVATLAGDIRAAPAGADGGTVLAVLVIAAAIWYFVYRR